MAPLGGGGAAQVYRAIDQDTDTAVALKLFPPSPVSAAEFRREAAIAERVRHPNLIQLVHAGVEEGHPYLVLELVEGVTLRAWLVQGQAVPERVLDLCRQLFAGLDAMHRAGIAHGDIKPDNILLQGDTLRIIDFGRARLAHLLGGGEGMFPGTPAYMHPRLYRGGAPEPLTDCFAAWVTVYELLAGRRPYPMSMLQWAEEGDLNDFPPLIASAHQRLVFAGLTGGLAEARRSWLAITRALRGRTDLPNPRPVHPAPAAARVDELLTLARQGRSAAVVGQPEQTQPMQEALDRAWRDSGGRTLWIRSDWGGAASPLSAALSLAANAVESFHGPELAAMDEDLGPLGGVLAAAVPAVRAWITASPTALSNRRSEPEQLALALRRLIDVAPRPLLAQASGLDRIDGSSRRFLGSLVVGDRLTLIGDALPHSPHGMPLEIVAATTDATAILEDERKLSPRSLALLHRARALKLALGPLFARASGASEAEVEEAALEAEALGVAIWTGDAVLPLASAAPADPAQVAAWCAEASRRLSADADPILVARYALMGGDLERLSSVLDSAIAQFIRLDPSEALKLLVADPRPPTPQRVLRHFRIALLARDLKQADAALAQLRALDSVSPADLAEAEGELAFRLGENLPALDGYLRAVAGLGWPVTTGLRGKLASVAAMLHVMLGRPPKPKQNPRVGRLYEHIYDLYFCVDHNYLLAVHRTWLMASPDDPRARVIQVIWHMVLGQPARAAALEATLLESIREEEDPVGAAVVLLHRGIARSMSGDTMGAFADGVDAAERLLRAGDPYLAALATTLPSVCAVHLGMVGQLARLNDRLMYLVSLTGERRASAWTRGNEAVIRWSWGDMEGALQSTRRWADESAALSDAHEALARRFLADLLLEGGRWREAVVELRRCEVVVARAGLRADYAAARFPALLMADAQARREGERVLRTGFARWRSRRLMASSPRWTPRVLVAMAWQAASRGRKEAALRLFERALIDAQARNQAQDAWWVLHHQSLALDDAAAAERAAALAATHGLKSGPVTLTG